jgi:hypothetical protein
MGSSMVHKNRWLLGWISNYQQLEGVCTVTAVNAALTDTLLFGDENCTVIRHITTFQSTMDCIHDGGKNFLETLDKLIVEENYLPEQIFHMDETSLFWKRMPERTFIHKEAKVMPGFKVCVSTFYDIRTTTKLPFSGSISIIKRRMTVLKQYIYSLFVTRIRFLSSTVHFKHKQKQNMCSKHF